MFPQRTHPGVRSRFRAAMLFVLVATLLASCGPLDDDDEPTATVESIAQPTTEPDAATESATDTDADVTDSAATPSPSEDSTPAPGTHDGSAPAGTPSGHQPDNSGTPDDGSTAIISTPAVPGINGDESGSTPEADSAEEPADAPPPFTGSDGTSGATPIPIDGGTAAGTPVARAPQATPDGTPGLAVLEETRQAPEIDLTAIDPVVVDSCEPENVPLLIEGELSYVTTFDVNFRMGPGSDCDTIGDGPLGANVPVLVVSAPVVREGDDEFLWVQVRVNDITGWVIVDAIEPAG